MASFDQEKMKTAGKMSDLVMETASQFIARDFLEAYERVLREERFDFVPAEFDDKIYKKIAKSIRKKTETKINLFRLMVKIIVAAVCVSSLAFTIAVLLNETLRHEIFTTFGF